MLDIGFKGSRVDTSLFIYIFEDITLYLFIYVDDLIIMGSSSTTISSLILRLQQEFLNKDLGPLSFFLGIQVSRTAHDLHLCQSNYISDILH